MTALVLNCITSKATGRPGHAEEFERALGKCESSESAINDCLSDLTLTGPLARVYIQFHYDLEGVAGSIKGIKIGRFSTTHRDVQARVEIPRTAFDPLDDVGRVDLLKGRVIEILRSIAKRPGLKDDDGLRSLLQRLEYC